jgi:transcriptional regulator with XRE-family HTH domain
MAQIKDKELLTMIAARIKQLRARHDLSQEAFFNDTNIHIARIETGDLNISVSTLNAICKYFNISLKDFFSEGFES